MTAQEALQHPWFKQELEESSDTGINVNVIKRLQAFKGTSKLKKAAMNMLVKMSDQNKIEGLTQQFSIIDKDGTGLISAEELRNAIEQSDLQIPKDQVEDIISQVDYFGNNKINYTEFLVATIDTKNFLDDNKLMELFH